MNKHRAGGAAKEAIGKEQADTGKALGGSGRPAKSLARQAAGRLQKASADVKEALRNSRHT